MTLTVKLFGMLKTLLKQDADLTVELSAEGQVSDLIEKIQALNPELGELLLKKKVLVSVNHDIAHGETVLTPTDEIALLPPFAGGATNRESETMSTVDAEEAMLVRVQRENFSIDEEIERVKQRSKRIGGIATFLGTARDRSQGRDVSSITFEHYEGMAQKKLREIRERALQDFDIIEALILHRYGAIDIGENIVLIVIGAEHRADAFKACKWCIDELKQITPIWKLEQTPEGEVWVEQHP
ncbi:molybdenum cofactor biosynthesis protein [Candidatus Nitronereus thalassa]|uniref:Molybdopterin synthase catalytic subunit n=1 Tax=Candidatus Nitronereus thalassa TaxID=3020898 RepID=A0ABU3K6H2_9BACT|nr:molybdenum cofactor biosynthesis protein MoaE [Candidatus Nitronereus thalassa]MDT7041933.1 molybdenum cofactor biosynthesis protein MoaE [Candidatus Nitronereus thalassa]